MAKDEESGMKNGFLIGFLAGGVVGAIVALLYAPKPGKELRSDIKAHTDEFIDSAEEYVSAAKNKAVEIINEGKKRSETLITEAKKRAESLLGDAEKILTEAKEKKTKHEDSKNDKTRT